MGKLPNWLGEVKNLMRLSLFYKKLEGPIPTSLRTLQQLEFLDGIGQLSQPKELNVYVTPQFSGVIFFFLIVFINSVREQYHKNNA